MPGPFFSDEDDKANQLALWCGAGRILSAYVTALGFRLWRLTDCRPGGQAETCLMLPSDY